ncbi:MAG: protein kinase [Planctomycetes bacterium]|nr:protein kinase [Planctomycetota bacterium]
MPPRRPNDEPEEPSGEDFLDALLSTAFADDPELEAADSRAARAKTPEHPTSIGPYAVLDMLGSGGVATVWRVFDGELERELAVKLLRPELRGDVEMERRLEEEARISSRLDHPGIVAVHARGRIADGRPYFAMRLVEGRTLAELFAARSENDNRKRLEILEQVASALAHAHRRGIVHGDVKPQNIMVGAFGEVQLMDWGFAFELEERPGETRKRRVGGTPAYMSPEQARGERDAISPRTDVFGLGAMLCEMLTGAPPYRGATKREVVAQATLPALDDAYARLQSCGAGAALTELARRCLAPRPDQRLADAGQVALALNGYLSELEARARGLEIEAAAANARAAQERRARRLGYTLAATLALVSLAASTLWIAWQNARASREETTRSGFEALCERAETLVEEARLDPLAESDLWDRAVGAAREADTWIRARESTPDDRLRATELIARSEAERERARRDRTLRDRILALRAEFVDDVHLVSAELRYSAIFRELGIDVDAPEGDDARAAIRESALKEHLIQTLDAWTYLRRRTGQPDPEAWRRTLSLARSLDADTLREALRSAYADRDVERFLALLAAQPDLTRFPPRSHDLVANCLREMGREAEAIEFLRRALEVHPGDATLTHSLASFLGSAKEPRWDEIERLLWMAHAVRPRDAHLLCDLARILILRERFDEALKLLDRADKLEPPDDRARFFRGFALVLRGSVASGEEILRSAIREGSGLAAMFLAQQLSKRGGNAAAAHYAELAARQGVKPADVEALRTGIYYDGRDLVRAQQAGARAIQLDPTNSLLREFHLRACIESGAHDAARAALADWRRAIERGDTPSASLEAWEREIGSIEAAWKELDREGLVAAEEDPEVRLRLGILAQRAGRFALALELHEAALQSIGSEPPPSWSSEAARCAMALAREHRAEPAKARALRDRAQDLLRQEIELHRDLEVIRRCRLLSSFLVDPLWAAAREGADLADEGERAAWRELFHAIEDELAENDCAVH